MLRRGEQLHIYHRDALVATHPVLEKTHQMTILPEHGPGAIARNARLLRSSLPLPGTDPRQQHTEVEIRDLAVYESLLEEVTG